MSIELGQIRLLHLWPLRLLICVCTPIFKTNLSKKLSQLSDTIAIPFVFRNVLPMVDLRRAYQTMEDYPKLNKVLSGFLEAIRMIRVSLLFLSELFLTLF